MKIGALYKRTVPFCLPDDELDGRLCELLYLGTIRRSTGFDKDGYQRYEGNYDKFLVFFDGQTKYVEILTKFRCRVFLVNDEMVP